MPTPPEPVNTSDIVVLAVTPVPDKTMPLVNVPDVMAVIVITLLAIDPVPTVVAITVTLVGTVTLGLVTALVVPPG